MPYLLVCLCSELHETNTLLIRPEVGADGSVNGYAGSDADFCRRCERPIVFTTLQEV